MFSNVFENRDVYEIMWENTVEPDRSQASIWYGACTLYDGYRKATSAHSQYAMQIAFPKQQWMHERASVLGYTCTCIVRLITCTVLYDETAERTVLSVFIYIYIYCWIYIYIYCWLASYNDSWQMPNVTHNLIKPVHFRPAYDTATDTGKPDILRVILLHFLSLQQYSM